MNKDIMTEQKYIDVLKSLGFQIENNIIHLSDELPILSPVVQRSIDVLCRIYDYECEMGEIDE